MTDTIPPTYTSQDVAKAFRRQAEADYRHFADMVQRMRDDGSLPCQCHLCGRRHDR